VAKVTRSVGRYDIVEELGRGGMAIVFLARQTDLDRLVALKELSTFHASDPAFARRFLRESRLAGSLSHPNIVTVHEYFEHEGTPYIAMEYIQRGSLRPYVGRLSLAQVVGVVEGMLAGLAHAETKGIVHRDLKPENVMVTDEGRVKIADFGIAKAGSDVLTGPFLTATGTTVGTPAYMAPEQAMAKDIGPWTDLYSLGVMAYEMLVGQLPFPDNEAPMALLMKHVSEPVPSPRSINPELDEELSAWLERLLEKSPDERIRSAGEAWDELEESVIRIFGARWRREARLPKPAATADMPRPLTPAPFHEPIEDEPAGAPGDGEEFKSFAWGGAPAAAPQSPQAPDAVPAPGEAPDAGLPAVPEPAEPPGQAPEPEPTSPQAEEHKPGFVTYGKSAAEAPPEPVEEPTVEPEAPEPVATAPEVWPATVAPKSTPAPPPPAEPVREPARAARAAPAKRKAGAGPLILLVGVVAVGAVVGWLVAPNKKQASAPRTVTSSASNTALELRFPQGWRRTGTAPQVSGLRLADPVVLAGPQRGAAVVAGTTDASGPTLLPSKLLSRLPANPRAVSVGLGPVAAYRYAGLAARSPSQRLTVYAVPTSAGVVTLACVGAVAGAPACESIASTLRLQSARPFPLGPSKDYAKALGSAIEPLNTARSNGRAALTAAARKPADYAQAAGSLSAAYASAAGALRKQVVSPADGHANAKIVAALTGASHAYRDVASAARKRDRRAYRTASAKVTAAERRVSDAIAGLHDLGYVAS